MAKFNFKEAIGFGLTGWLVTAYGGKLASFVPFDQTLGPLGSLAGIIGGGALVYIGTLITKKFLK